MFHTGRFRKTLLWLLPLMFAAASSLGQNVDRNGYDPGNDPSLPAWAVPVLKLVSATHVEPTTGVVLSASGLVLVPAEFAAPGDEIIVLDGGTDIIRNGRPARIERKFSAEGVLVLSVPGLARSGFSLSADPLADGETVLLAAFPPAEQIAEGEPPLNVPASLVVFRESGMPAVSGETPLPNVTGPLIDDCGDLAGFSMADDVQSMEVSPATRYLWRNSVQRIFQVLQIEPEGSGCAISPQQEPEIEETAQPPVAEPEPVAEEETPPPAAPDSEPEPETPAPEEPAVEPDPLPALDIDILPPIEKDVDSTPVQPEEEKPAGWLWLIAAGVLFAVGFVIHRLRKASQDDGENTADAPTDATPIPAIPAEETGPDPATTALDSVLLIEGILADGTPFEASCAVSRQAINVVIGRGDTDLFIDSAAVSRQHARLNGTAEELTLADLGSSNGSSVNGVPCLEGEILYIGLGDSIVLGDAQFRIEIRPQQPAGSNGD